MPKYFKPKATPNNANYQVVRKTRGGKLVRDQLPCEGIYTVYEMSRIQETIPGEWLNVPAKHVGYVFGLRQILSDKE